MSDTSPSRSPEEDRGETESPGKAQPAALLISLSESPPRGSSLLLCPAQWSALLEAAPVSLVVREMRERVRVSEEADFECEGESEVEEREGERVPRLVFAEDDEIRTPLGGRTPDPDRTYCTVHDSRHHFSEAETLENVALELDNPSSPSPNLPPPPPPPPPPHETHPCSHHATGVYSPSLPTSPLTAHSAHLTAHSSHSTPSHSVAHLELTMELDVLPQQPATPPEHRHQVAWSENRHTSPLLRHSLTLPPSPSHSHAHPHSHDTDARQWPSYQTHSRNISETPSLPLFHSSSTSSAYHSRNSSLGSQLSSCCFESDSLLNQLSDMDSALAVRTGSHGDLKQPMRFHRRGDTSPCCSDLSLPTHLGPHHLPSPLLHNRVKGLSLSPSLEETLCHCSSTSREYILESMEEKRRSIKMKSSEWIKQELEKNKDSMVQVKVSSKTKHMVHYNVKCGDIIIWEFATKKRDIGFGVLFEETEVATEQAPLPSSHESIEKKVASILPLFRVSTHAHPTIGYHCATQDGVYEILFDNTYSRFFAKELFYRITTQSSEPNVNYLEQ